MTDWIRKRALERIEALGLTQPEVAARAGLKPDHLNALLKGRRRGLPETWESILAAIDLTLTVTTKDPAPNPSEAE